MAKFLSSPNPNSSGVSNIQLTGQICPAEPCQLAPSAAPGADQTHTGDIMCPCHRAGQKTGLDPRAAGKGTACRTVHLEQMHTRHGGCSSLSGTHTEHSVCRCSVQHSLARVATICGVAATLDRLHHTAPIPVAVGSVPHGAWVPDWLDKLLDQVFAGVWGRGLLAHGPAPHHSSGLHGCMNLTSLP